ncbi:hypothetical protein Gohar_025029 [Gossypium harknessii]|uniref:Metallothionein-like protein n=1 Tax=Gossypium harknessii TaxID=34285 RepID=A0A7J9HI92_9ROSI|nr:hypothetical protein [Gossypium harknessii]MBA0809368.1 hypothetical protein [Gossypium harknessii]
MNPCFLKNVTQYASVGYRYVSTGGSYSYTLARISDTSIAKLVTTKHMSLKSIFIETKGFFFNAYRKKGNALVIETEKSYISTVVVEAVAENGGKCKCGASCSCTNCTCGNH